jgi:predicted RNase H-like HicB family nuclease
MERLYIALIHKDRATDFGVSFSEFPGCVTAGTTVEEAFSLAKEALAGHIETMIESGLEIPSLFERVVDRPNDLAILDQG